MKPKLVIWSDFVAPTGFGNVAKNLFRDLHKTFDVSVVAINYYGNKKYDTSKYFIYSAKKDDVFNKQNLFSVIKQEQPNLIILFQDSFNIAEVLPTIKTISPNSKVIIYFPVDASEFSIAWHDILNDADAVITYTDWAVSILRKAVPAFTKPIYKLYHGIDPNVFFPLPYEKVEALRKEANWDNKFVICNVNRFQPRKAIPLSIRAFSLFAKGYKICKCGNWYPIHRDLCDLNGCGETEIVNTVNCKKDDVYYYLHMSPHEVSMGLSRTNSLQNHVVTAGFRDADYGKIIGINNVDMYSETYIPEEIVNEIYNCSNINFSTSNGEGFGLSLTESAATGTRSIAPNNSAIPEVLKGTGTLLNNVAVYSHPFDNAFMRPIVDVKEAVVALENEYKRWVENGRKKQIDLACLNLVKTHYDWDNIREALNKIITSIL